MSGNSDKTVYVKIGGNTFYFPGVHPFRRLEKDITKIKLPKKTVGRDFRRTSETFNLRGVWQDDITGDYDSKYAFDRYLLLFAVVKYGTTTSTTGPDCYLTWQTSTYKCKCKTIKPSKYAGHGTDIEYDITFVRVTTEK